MKELSVEEKAQRYDEALERARYWEKNPTVWSSDDICQKLFPELKESSDERIRKSLLYVIEHHPTLSTEEAEEYIAWLEKQGEQKPADKVEPKFREGDWVVYCNDDVDLITGIEENGYCINNGGYIPFVCENEMRLWDITDAKVEDVLVSESTCGLGTWYCIFKSLDGDESMTVYCYLARDGRFETKKELCFDKDPYNTKPATKEQRDTLMKAMTDAGYTFDFEKKELKKIVVPKFNVHDCVIKKHNSNINDFGSFVITDISGGKYWYNDRIICDIAEQDEWEIYEPVRQKPAWSEEDTQYINDTLALLSFGCSTHSVGEVKEWLQSLNNRVQPKQEWSEEDKRNLNDAILFIKTGTYSLDKDNLINWLKSLSPQPHWKPSEEQMEALNYVVNLMASSASPKQNDYYYNVFKNLRKQLKKLRGNKL